MARDTALLPPVQTVSGQLEADIASLVRSSALVTSTTSPDNPLLPVTVQVELCRRSLAVDQE